LIGWLLPEIGVCYLHPPDNPNGKGERPQASAVVIIGLSKFHRILVSKHFAKNPFQKL
jgi:hypothetical protein